MAPALLAAGEGAQYPHQPPKPLPAAGAAGGGAGVGGGVTNFNMWNYQDVDKYISIKHFQLIAKWFESRPRLHQSDDMMIQSVQRIEPGGSEYWMHLTAASMGYTLRISIAGEEVTASQPENFWMS